jgi:hypothetical protein
MQDSNDEVHSFDFTNLGVIGQEVVFALLLSLQSPEILTLFLLNRLRTELGEVGKITQFFERVTIVSVNTQHLHTFPEAEYF